VSYILIHASVRIHFEVKILGGIDPPLEASDRDVGIGFPGCFEDGTEDTSATSMNSPEEIGIGDLRR
jgi:hypothetical protein